MFLRNSFGHTFALGIAGYQFPSSTDSWDDANWLVVEVAASGPAGVWRFRDPALQTAEATRLAAWLETVASGRRPVYQRMDFLEPVLAFELQEPASRRFRVLFELEGRPPWANDRTAERWGEVGLEFEPSPGELQAAAGELRAALRRFPERGKRDRAFADPSAGREHLAMMRRFLVESVQWLAADADAQLAAVPDDRFVCDEMVLTFALSLENARDAGAGVGDRLFDEVAAGLSAELAASAAELGGEDMAERWSPIGLRQHQEWEDVRAVARRLLDRIGEPRCDADLRRLSAVGKSHWVGESSGATPAN